MDKKLSEWLERHSINYILHFHDAVYTVSEAKEKTGTIPGLHCKNLFLKNSKMKIYFLVTLPAEKIISLLELSQKLDVKKLSFAKPEELVQILQLEPGSVSPLGLVNDHENKVNYIIDAEVWNANLVCFHPNINTETLELHQADFQKLINVCGNKYTVLDL